MIALLALASGVLAASAPVPRVALDEASFVDASLAFDGELLDFEFVDVDGRGARELLVTLLGDDGRRRLAVHAANDRGYDARPLHSVEILEDVIAYGVADVRAEAGRELVLLTRSGAYSYSLTKDGYRGNVARLVDAPLLFDVPDPTELPYWPYVLEADGGDRVLLPERGGFAIFGPRAGAAQEGEAAYERQELFARSDGALPDLRGGAATRERGGGSFSIVLEGQGPILGELERRRNLLRNSQSYAAPALADVNGDGELDLVRLGDEGLDVHLGRSGRWSAEPSRSEVYPEYLGMDDDEQSARLRIEDLDGDGRPDLLATVEREGSGFGDSDVRVLLLVNDGRRLLPQAPTQVLRFDTGGLTIDVVDANGDGRPDLSLRKFNFPSLVETVTGLEFKLTYLLFLGERARGRVVARNPVLKQTQSFDENGVQQIIKVREFSLDCSGDGMPDLVEIDLSGNIAIRRLTLDSGFFSGDTWELETSPWKTFDVRGDVRDLVVDDLNGDGIGDVVSRGEDGLTLLVSRRKR